MIAYFSSLREWEKGFLSFSSLNHRTISIVSHMICSYGQLHHFTIMYAPSIITHRRWMFYSWQVTSVLNCVRSLLLSTVSGEGAKERTDRVVLTPWVKFLWESYRNMLELLKNNPTSLSVYTEVAKKAFDFCLNYQRRTEFRKLCEIVRCY